MSGDDASLDRLATLVSDRTGLRLDSHNYGALRKIGDSRAVHHGFSTLEEYRRFLEADTPESRMESREIASLLTVGESYFFRDAGQFQLIREKLLPDLLERRGKERTLRIWSAGCSTGEEPYSLAILLYETIPDIADWLVLIFGTDIKEEFLQKAKKAVYGEWSFRMVPDVARKKYFTERNGAFELDTKIKNMVTFRRNNLLDDVFPESFGELCDLDLILCRNVFIYYRRKTVVTIAKKMAKCLRVGGYLITGHWELFSVPSGLLVPRMFPESLAYQRVSDGSAIMSGSSGTPASPTVFIPPQVTATYPIAPFASPVGEQESQNTLAEAEKLFKNGAYRKAAALLEMELRKTPNDFRSLCLTANAYANLGEHELAVKCLRKAIDVNSLSAEPYYLLARIAEENGDIDSTKKNLGKVIYLEPASVGAYLDLAAIHEREGNMEKARKMRRAALDALRRMPKESIVEPYGTTAAEFIRLMEELLG